MKNSFKKLSLMFSALMLCGAFIIPTNASVAVGEDAKTCYVTPCLLPGGAAICCLEATSGQLTCTPCGGVIDLEVEQ